MWAVTHYLIIRELVNKWKCGAEPAAKFLEVIQQLQWKENTPGQIFPEGECSSDSAQFPLSKWGLSSGWISSKDSQSGAINKGMELLSQWDLISFGSISDDKLHCSEPQRSRLSVCQGLAGTEPLSLHPACYIADT